jgi:hypothetical protein
MLSNTRFHLFYLFIVVIIVIEAWDWFQGRSKDTFEYSTFRHRKYGYVVQVRQC